MSGAFSGIIEKVTFANKWPVLMKATSDDEQPIPGYLYQEINKLSLMSGSYCNDLLDCLLERANNHSCHVKYKSLRLLKFVVENGHPDFRRSLRKKSTVIQESMKCGGPPDPVHGSTPYAVVRNEAKELSRLLFEVEESDLEVPRDQNRKLEGIGSGSHPGGMQGFGNAPHRAASRPNILTNLKELAEKALNDPSELETAKTHTLQSQYTPVAPSADIIPVSYPNEHRHTKTRAHTPGKAGGGWEEEDVQPVLLERMPTVSDWSKESSIVNDLIHCKDSVLPKRHELNHFINRCHSANCHKVLEFVNVGLDSEITSVLMRSMLAVEMFLTTDLVSAEQVMSVCSSHLTSIYNEQNGQTQSKARKILRILGSLCPRQSRVEDFLPTPVSLSDSVQSLPFAVTAPSPEIPSLNAPFGSIARRDSKHRSQAFPFLYNS